ncbi:cellulase family glycosylhydrolase [Catellatospora sp. KI3]|uniref:cellulase family glycosylhydrolase n=1 Tax=Catellatospora sp. KI3 TaxID=3041620 RepID=UPI0032B19B7C
MKKKIALAALSALALLTGMLAVSQPAQAATGIRVSNGKLVEANGTALKLRGINHPHAWYATQTSSFANIKAAGANSVRVVLSGGRWTTNTASDVANVISLCKTNKLICVLENHDTTGYGEQSGAYSLDQAVNYWISVQSALTGQENYVILNIGNEPFGNNATTPNWTDATKSAIGRLRSAGFQHTIMVDAPNWGQDWSFTMRDNAPSVLAADTTGNLIFSVHMYGVFDTAAEVTAYVDSFTSRNLALCVCEFGDMHSDGNPDEDTIMAKTQSAGIGNMGWSWSGNGGGVEYLDMVTSFNPAQRSTWGTRYITGANGLSTTSTQATIYNTSTDNQAPTTPGTPAASNVTSSSVSLSWAASTDNVGVTGYDVVRVSGSTETVVASPSTNSASVTGLTASTAYTFAVYAKDAAGNRSTRSGTVAVTTATAPVDTQAPTAPGTPTASNVTSSSVSLGWTASTDNVGVTGYDVVRVSGSTETVVASPSTNSASVTGLTASTAYTFAVYAKDAAGNRSTRSGTVAVTTSGTSTGGCTAAYRITNSWPGGFQAEVVITNGATATTAWTASWTFANGQTITQLWSGQDTPSGASHSVRNLSYNGTLAPSGTTSFGFTGTWNNSTNAVPTVACSRS